jgi:hypothetical protein
MKKWLFTIIFAALITVNAQADTVGLYLGGQIWQSEPSGIFGEKNALINFHLKKEQQSNYFVAIEHPFSLLPNARISSTTLDTTGKNNSVQEFKFADTTFPIDNDANTNFNVSYVDYTLYYELFDNDFFSFDLGLTARDFKGDITVTGTTIIVYTDTGEPVLGDNCHETGQAEVCDSYRDTYTPTGKIKIDDILPMLYFASNTTLPLTGLSMFAQGDFLLIDDHSFYDYQLGLSYDLVNNMMIDFNLTLGYRAVKMTFKDIDSLYSDLKFKGTFIGVIAHF